MRHLVPQTIEVGSHLRVERYLCLHKVFNIDTRLTGWRHGFVELIAFQSVKELVSRTDDVYASKEKEQALQQPSEPNPQPRTRTRARSSIHVVARNTSTTVNCARGRSEYTQKFGFVLLLVNFVHTDMP